MVGINEGSANGTKITGFGNRDETSLGCKDDDGFIVGSMLGIVDGMSLDVELEGVVGINEGSANGTKMTGFGYRDELVAKTMMDLLSSWDLSSENLRTMVQDLPRSLDAHWDDQMADWMAFRLNAWNC